MQRKPLVGSTGRQRDAGVTLIEILITIVLLSVGVTAILAALRTTTTASTIDREHAAAFAWLQEASENVYRATRVSCNGNSAAVVAAEYRIAAKATTVPAGWTGATIDVTSVEFLGHATFDAPYEWDASYCLEGPLYAGASQYTQRVTIQVRTPGGIVKTLQMVKGM